VRTARLSVVLGAWALVAACRVEPVEATGDPAATVRAYFEAIAAGDCPRLQASLAGPALERFEASGCQALLDEHARHDTALLQCKLHDPMAAILTGGWSRSACAWKEAIAP
jgi:hypothetical protein